MSFAGCPGEDRLRRMLDDRLPADESGAIEAHLESCAACREAVERMIAWPPAAVAAEVAPETAAFLDRLRREAGPPRLIEAPGQRPGPGMPAIAGFRLVGEIGRGGMGTVYEAVELALDRRVALKVIPRLAASPDAIERFRREARAAARLHHTNIVPVFGVGETGTHLYYAMQLIRGGRLDRAFGRVGGGPASTRPRAAGPGSDPTTVRDPDAIGPAPEPPPPTPEEGSPSGVMRGQGRYLAMARAALQVAEALEHAHHQGVLHRDVKPSNILIDEAGDAWVADFGLAKIFDGDAEGLTRTGDVVGTIRYMAPERFEGRSDARSDVYSLGVTLYEVATARPAFRAPDRAHLIAQILGEPPARPRQVDRRIPPDLETVILKAMAREPARRYATAAELAADLRRFLSGEPILARRAGVAERAWRWSRREPVVAGLAAAVVLAVAAGFGLTFWQWRRALSRSAEAVAASSRAEWAEVARTRERDQAIQARRSAERLAVRMTYERALGLLERGEATEGRLWLVRALENPELEPAQARLARLNLSAWEAATPRLSAILGADAPIVRFAFEHPGNALISLDADRMTLRRHDPRTGGTIGGPTRLRRRAEDGPDRIDLLGRWAPVRHNSGTRTIQFHDPATGAALADPIRLAADVQLGWSYLSDDGSAALGIAEPGVVRVWSTATGRPIGPPIRMGDRAGHPVLLGPDGRRLLAIRPDGGRFWDVATGRPSGDAPGLASRPERILWTPEHLIVAERGEPEAGGGRGDWTLRFFGPDGTPRGSISAPPHVDKLQAGPDGTTLALILNNGQVGLFDARRMAPIVGVLPTRGDIDHLAFSPDGASLATGGSDGLVQQWTTADGRPIGEPLAHPGSILDLAFSPDGRSLAVQASDGTIRLWSLPTRTAWPAVAVSTPAGVTDLSRVAIAPAGRRALIRGRRMASCQIATPGRGASPSPIPIRWHEGASQAVSPDGRRYATASHGVQVDESELRLWDADGRPIGGPLPHQNWINDVAFSPDGGTLAAVGFGGTVYFFDAETGRPRPPFLFTKRIGLSLAFAPDGRSLAVGTGPSTPTGLSPQVQVWDFPPSGRPPRAADLDRWAVTVNFTPDGRSLLVQMGITFFRNRDSTLQVWDAATLRPRSIPMAGSTAQPDEVAFLTPERALSDGKDGLWDWDLASGRAARTPFPRDRPLIGLVASTGTDRVAILGGDGAARVVDLATLRPVGPPVRKAPPILAVSFDEAGRLSALSEEATGARWQPLDDATGPMAGDDPAALAAATGMELDPADEVPRPIPAGRWTRLRERSSPVVRSAPGDDLAWHEWNASEAAARGWTFSAIWHLDRIAAARPDDWTLPARRALARADSGSIRDAEGDLALAGSLAPPDALPSWLRARASDSLDRERVDLAAWCLDRCLQLRPTDRDALVARSELHDQLGRDGAASADLSRAVGLGLDEDEILRHADRLARLGRWARVTGLIAEASSRRPGISADLVGLWATAGLLAGDPDAYHRACARLIGLTRDAKTGALPNDTGYACALGRDAVPPAVLAELVRSTAAELDAIPRIQAAHRHGVANTLAALLLRAGDHAGAIARLEAAIRESAGPDEPEDVAILALAHLGLGHLDRALAERARLDAMPPAVPFWRNASLDVLRREVHGRVVPATPEAP